MAQGRVLSPDKGGTHWLHQSHQSSVWGPRTWGQGRLLTWDQGPGRHRPGQSSRLQALRPSGRASLQCLECTERVVLLCRGWTQRTERACVPVRPQLWLHGSHSPVIHLSGHSGTCQPLWSRCTEKAACSPWCHLPFPHEGALSACGTLPKVLQMMAHACPLLGVPEEPQTAQA